MEEAVEEEEEEEVIRGRQPSKDEASREAPTADHAQSHRRKHRDAAGASKQERDETSRPCLRETWKEKKRTECPNVGGVSIRRRDGAPSRRGALVNCQLNKASDKCATPPPPTKPTLPHPTARTHHQLMRLT